jgi:hypothetical protein
LFQISLWKVLLSFSVTFSTSSNHISSSLPPLTVRTAIEVITSKEKTVKQKNDEGEEVLVNVRFWNPTLANLSLIALGSSAPGLILYFISCL